MQPRRNHRGRISAESRDAPSTMPPRKKANPRTQYFNSIKASRAAAEARRPSTRPPATPAPPGRGLHNPS